MATNPQIILIRKRRGRGGWEPLQEREQKAAGDSSLRRYCWTHTLTLNRGGLQVCQQSLMGRGAKQRIAKKSGILGCEQANSGALMLHTPLSPLRAPAARWAADLPSRTCMASPHPRAQVSSHHPQSWTCMASPRPGAQASSCHPLSWLPGAEQVA